MENEIEQTPQAVETVVKVVEWLDMGIFPPLILFSYRFTYDELMAQLRKLNAEHWDTGLSGDKELIDGGTYFALSRILEHKDNGDKCHLYYIIITEEFTFSDYDICKLAHEVLHICQFAFPRILNMDREHEAVAYTHTYLMGKCLQILRETHKQDGRKNADHPATAAGDGNESAIAS